jgi:pSer/pThr/pTyr-binding forkhead associated (FHA) protein
VQSPLLVLVIVLLVGGVAAVAGWLLLRRRPMAKLTLLESDAPGLEFTVRDRMTSIGREESRTVTVSHPLVSRHHADLILRDGTFVLRDRSTRGTHVNGEPIQESVLKSGALIRLAESVELIFTRLS